MIRLGICGYGNLGRGAHSAIMQNDDIELIGVFTRRNPKDVPLLIDNTRVYNIEDAKGLAGDIDVMLLCGGSATDLGEQGPLFAASFNTVDSFDTHAKIPQYYSIMNEAAKKSNHVSMISIGWDPGLFSMNRLLFNACLPQGADYTFWGKGVSQGHSDAIRRIEGVRDGVQYTVPLEDAVNIARSGKALPLTAAQKHSRICYVVLEEDADQERIASEIKNMPNYFADYTTDVHFISADELAKNHKGMPHGGFVIKSGKTGPDKTSDQIMEFRLKLESNPEFTASVLIAYARAAFQFSKEGKSGAFTAFDVPLSALSHLTHEQLIASYL